MDAKIALLLLVTAAACTRQETPLWVGLSQLDGIKSEVKLKYWVSREGVARGQVSYEKQVKRIDPKCKAPEKLIFPVTGKRYGDKLFLSYIQKEQEIPIKVHFFELTGNQLKVEHYVTGSGEVSREEVQLWRVPEK